MKPTSWLTLADLAAVGGASSTPSCTGDGSNLTEDHYIQSGPTCGFTDPSDHGSTAPQLGPLQDNGGPTPTLALLAGSPAIDAGSGDCPPPGTDQRGVARPVDGNEDGTAACDIGAFEFQPGGTTTTTTLPGASPPRGDVRLDLLPAHRARLGDPGGRAGGNDSDRARAGRGHEQPACEEGRARSHRERPSPVRQAAAVPSGEAQRSWHPSPPTSRRRRIRSARTS
jgi:hypothetical protein